MRVVGVTGGEFTLASDAANTTDIPLDTVTALDPQKSIPIPGGNFFGLDIVANSGAGEQRRAKDWGYIPSLALDGLNMRRQKAGNTTASETDTGQCYWLEFTEGGAAEANVRAILKWDRLTSASSSPDSIETYNSETWPANVSDANDLMYVYAFTSRSGSNSSDQESHIHIARSGTTFTVTPGGGSPDMDVWVWVVELSGSNHSVQSIEWTRADYQAQLTAATTYVPGSAYSAGDVFSAPTEIAGNNGRYVCTAPIATAPALVNGLLTEDAIAPFAHFIGWDENAFELTLAAAVDWNKSVILPACWSHSDAVTNPMDNAQLHIVPGSAGDKVSCEIGFVDGQRTDPATRRGALQVWTFNDPAIGVQYFSELLGSLDSDQLTGDRSNIRGSEILMETQDPDSGEDDTVGSYAAWIEQNSDDRSEPELIAGNYGAILRYGTSGVTVYRRRSYNSAAQRMAVRVMTGLDRVTASNIPTATFEVISGNSQAYTLRATLDFALPGGVITTLNGTLGDTVSANAGATDTVSEFDIVADDHLAGGDLEHTVTGRVINMTVASATTTSLVGSATLPASWQRVSTVTQANSPSESVARLITDIPAKVGDVFDAYGSEADAGRVTEEGRPYNAVAPFTLDLKLYDSANQIWSGKRTEVYSVEAVDLIDAQISQNLTDNNGLVDWPGLGFINVDDTPWVGDGDCIRPQSLAQFSRIVHASSRLTEDYAEVIIMNGSPDDNDTFGPAFYTSIAATSGYHLEITSNGTLEPDRIEFREQDEGVFSNIDFVVLSAPLTDQSLVSLGRFKSTGTLVIKVNGLIVKTLSNNKHICDNWGLIAEQRNLGTGCIKAIAANGQSSLQIASINGQVGIVSLADGPVTVEWTEDHAPTSFDVVDGAGLVHTFAAVALSASQSQFTFDGADVWHGPVIVRANTLEQRGANFLARSGEQYVNLQSVISAAGQLMGFQPNDQVTLGLTTNIGQPIKLYDNGDVVVDGGELTQFISPKRHDGTTRSAAATHYFYEAIAQTSQPTLNYQLGDPVAINLRDRFNSPLDVPTNQLGSSGSSYQVAVSGLPAGLSQVGNNITGTLNAAAGTYNVNVTITDQAGVPALTVIWPLVIAAANQSVQAVGTLPQQSGMARKVGGYQFAGAFNDPEGDPYVVTIDNPPSWLTLDADQQTLTWAPDDTETGTFDLVLRAASTVGDLTPATQALRLVILPFVNYPPIIGPIPNIGLQAGVTINRSIAIPASDPDGDSLSVDVLNPDGSALSGGLTFNAGSLSFNGKHNIGTVPVIARATDSQGATADRQFSLLFSLGAPVLTPTPIPDQVWEIGKPIPPLDLTDYIEGLPDSYTLSPLVSGVIPVGDSLQGTPDIGLSAGNQTLKITGTNSQGSVVTASFVVRLEVAFLYKRTSRHFAVTGR